MSFLPKNRPDSLISPLFERLAFHAATKPDAPAFLASGIAPLTYGRLHDTVLSLVTSLNAKGFHRASRIVVVMPPGPEMATAITAVASGMTCIPLNPALTATDWQRILADFAVDALLTVAGTAPMAERAAQDLSLPILEIAECGGDHPLDLIVTGPAGGEPASGRPGLDDDAFILPTSGTTSAPKGVPLTHRNISHSARATARSLRLTGDDRLLSVLPLHHAHGLISGLMASLYAGAGIIYMRAFDAPGFFDHLAAFRPTWFTAVPAIHQALIAEAPRHAATLEQHSLRLIRSASAPLSAARFGALEGLFGVPVIETFGMTEAASQVAANPLPPGRRKPGSVGVAAGPEISIMDDAGEVIEPGEIGTLCLRGPNMTRGYVSPDAASLQQDGDGWINTGDLGYLDEDGYLYITGRVKELINRGGEKLSPLKIEEVLLSHPDVAEAVAFAVPHPRLGEDVGAAVVLRGGAKLAVRDISRFALDDGRLRDAELPRHLQIVDEIPKTVTGKLRRAAMADVLGPVIGADDGNRPPYEPPENEVEQTVAAIWEEVFAIPVIGRGDNFFALGGDSLLAVQIALRIEDCCGVVLPLRALFEAPQVADLAACILACKDGVDTGFELTRADGTVQGPVSAGQEAMLEQEAALPGFPVFTMPFAYRLTGVLDASVLERCVKRLISRHEVLRMTFRKIGTSWRTSPANTVNTGLVVEDWRVIPESFQPTFIESAIDDTLWDIFDVTKAAGFRCRLMQFGDEDHVLVLTLHHIIMDAWTVKNLLEELFADYDEHIRGRPTAIESPEISFSDFARWQAEWRQGSEAQRQLAYWAGQLGGAPSICWDDARARVSFATGRVTMALSKGEVTALREQARGAGCTLYMAMLTAMQTFWAGHSGQTDIAVATPIANRSRPRTDAMIGLLENTVVIRRRVKPDGNFKDQMQAVRDVVLDAHAHQELPFEDVIRHLGPGVLPGIYFSLVDHNEPVTRMKGLTYRRIELSQDKNSALPLNSARFMFLLKVTGDRIIGSCVFKEDQTTFEEAEAIADGYLDHLRGLIEHPSE